jgi:hypothetical protein
VTQFITIGKKGGVCGLDDRGHGLDLAEFGEATKKRVGDIQWDVGKQRWEILFPRAIVEAILKSKDATFLLGENRFVKYSTAVDVEVQVLQQLQIEGQL